MPACPHCTEPLLEGEALSDTEPPFHSDCMIRQVVGSVGHQKHLCACYGGTGPGDPEGMSVREAARAAAEYFRSSHHVQIERWPN